MADLKTLTKKFTVINFMSVSYGVYTITVINFMSVSYAVYTNTGTPYRFSSVLNSAAFG